MKKIVSLFILTLVASGCDIDFTLNATPAGVDYTGYWYQEAEDYYLELAEDGAASIKGCSISEGYVAKDFFQASYSGDQFIATVGGVTKSTQTLSLDNDTLKVADDTATVTYTRVEEIPATCENDVVEFTLVTPDEVVEGEEVEFTVAFDYRLSSSDNATIYLGYSTGELNINSPESVTVTAKETNTGNLTITATPKIFDDGSPFLLGLTMYITKDDESQAVASDWHIIDVQPAGGTATGETTGSEAGGPSGD